VHPTYESTTKVAISSALLVSFLQHFTWFIKS